MPPPDPARQPVVLITGASSGIGRACADHLHARGCRVYGTSRRPQAVSGAGFALLEMDVTSDSSVQAAVERVIAEAGRLDVLVNNAGDGIAGAIEDTSVEEALAQFDTNFFGALRACRAVLPIMRARGSGLIVNIGSLAGVIAAPFQGMYSASKFALEGLSEALRVEVKPYGVRVVLIQPGDHRTEFTAHRRWVRAAQEGSPYREAAARAVAVMAHDEQHGADPLLVARLLERVIRARRPRLRYTVGPLPQRLAIALKGVLPRALIEWGLAKYYRLDG